MKAQKVLLISAIAILINAQLAVSQEKPMCRGGNRREECPTKLSQVLPFCKEGQNPKTDNCRPLIFLPE
jgi:hypothetical protein